MMFSTGQKSDDVLKYLETRRSCSLKLMGGKGPSHEEIQHILKIAARVPDHGKLNPWYFIVFEGRARKEIGSILKQAYQAEDPDASDAKLELEAEKFLRAPCVILVVSRIRPAKHPIWEQILSAGAVCHNLSLAASALGYGSNWLSEWMSYNNVFKKAIGLDARDHIAGAMYIGAVNEMPQERPRPVLEHITTFWQTDINLNKGDVYEPEKPQKPPKGFYFPDKIV